MSPGPVSEPAGAERPTIATVLRAAGRSLAAAGVAAPRRDARLIVARALDCGIETVIGHDRRPLDPAAVARVTRLVARRADREPLSRIFARREFWGLEFALDAATFDPRADSETLVEAVLGAIDDRLAPIRLLDLGSGSGCLLIALLSELPGARGLGIDISAAALWQARDNARRHALATRAGFLVADWAEPLADDRSWQVIVSNPPYIMDHAVDQLGPEVARFEPRGALSGGHDGLDAYRRLAGDIPRLLARGGIAAVELGQGQAPDVSALFEAAGLAIAGCHRDLAGIERCLILRG